VNDITKLPTYRRNEIVKIKLIKTRYNTLGLRALDSPGLWKDVWMKKYAYKKIKTKHLVFELANLQKYKTTKRKIKIQDTLGLNYFKGTR
jgi:hypothetical protein